MSRDHSLLPLDRLIISNQYKLLSTIAKKDEDKKYYDECRLIIERGYVMLYPKLTEAMSPEMPVDQSEEVLYVLNMFEALIRAYAGLRDKSGIKEQDVKFAGFDSNSEIERRYLIFAHFWCTSSILGGRYKLVLDNMHGFDSQRPMLDGYRRMLAVWLPLYMANPEHILSKAELLAIVQAR